MLRELGNYDEANWFYAKMLEEPNLSDDTRIHLYYNMGMMQKELGRTDKALEYFEKVKGLLELLMTKSNEIIPPRVIYIYGTESSLIAAYNNMGVLHNKNYNFDKAIIYYKQALEIKDGLQLEMAIVNNNLGCLYSHYGNYKEARNYHATAIELIDENQSCWGEFRRNLATVENMLKT